nr:galactose-specific lectin nattectin-like isoform X1 [Procambarus clarkii]
MLLTQALTSMLFLVVGPSTGRAAFEGPLPLQEVEEHHVTYSQHTEPLGLDPSLRGRAACCYGEAGVARAAEALGGLRDVVASLHARSVASDHGAACPYPYTKVISECFYAHQKKLTWSQARRVCQGMGGHLAEPVHPYGLQAYLAHSYGPGYFWVGGTDEGAEGSWHWVKSGRSIDAADWLFSRPDNRAGNEHCLEIVMSDYPGLYNDETCSVSQRFICQYKHSE